jgi:hypothetical protein
VQLQSCHSVDDITSLLQDQAQIVDDSQQRDRIVKSIKATVSTLIPISSGVSGADNFGLVSQAALMVYFTCLIVFTDIVCARENIDGRSLYLT